MKSSLTPPPNAPRPPVVPINRDEISIDLSKSCSREDAAAKLLGWLRGPILHKYIEVTSAGITVDQLKHISSLECTVGGTLTSQLTELHQSALIEFYNALDGAEKDKKSEIVVFWKNQIHKAAKYLRDIDHELDKENDSMLKLDKSEIDRSGNPHIKLSSLDLWAKDKYKFSIFDDVGDNPSKADDENPGAYEEFLKPDKINNFIITLALMTDFIAATKLLYRNGEDPCYASIAKDIVTVADRLKNKKVMYAQTEGNIRKLLSFAQHRKFQRMSAK